MRRSRDSGGFSVLRGLVVAAALGASMSGCTYLDRTMSGENAGRPVEKSVPEKKGGKDDGRIEPITPVDPKRLIGLDESAVLKTLGAPQSVREQPPARVWSYAAEGCSLDLFFYLDLGSKSFRTLTYDVKLAPKSARETTAELCVGRIHRKNHG